ncbi:MAG: 30S ribosomal protein S20 [Hyphomicrobiales bacterium]|nr:30S ribosomal protein S20 [Hyphomicrobiales bacterium]
MANTRSAKKAVRKIARRTEVNKARRTQMRTSIRKVEEAVASADKTAASEALKNAQPIIMRAVTKGILKKNTASRKVSRLAASVNKIGA